MRHSLPRSFEESARRNWEQEFLDCVALLDVAGVCADPTGFRTRTEALWCAIVINVWRGLPFITITFLAGLQTINPDMHEAADLELTLPPENGPVVM
jgi:ABC-type sugar transport system permease subunit